MRRALTLLFGIGLSVALLLYLFKDVNFGDFREEFQRLQLWPIVPIFFLFLLSLYLRAVRWRLLLPNHHREGLTTRDLFDATVIGFAATAVLPLRAGEIVRPLFLRRFSAVPFTSGLASIFTERVFDLVALLAVAGIAFSQVPTAPPFMLTTARALGGIAFIGIVGLLLCRLAGAWTIRVAEQLVPKILPDKISAKLIELLRQVVAVLSALQNLKEVALVILYSFLVWFVTAIYFVVSLHLFGESVALLTGFLLASTVAFAVAAPSSPGFIGTYQFGCTLTLTTLVGYPKEFSLAYALTVHLIQTVIILLAAAFIVWQRKIGFKDIFSTRT